MNVRCVLVLMLLGAMTSASGWDCAPQEAIEAYAAARELILSGDRESGIAKLKHAVSIYPDFYEAFEALEWEYKAQGRYAKAIEAAEQQIRLRPGMAEQREYNIRNYRRLLATPQAAKDALAGAARHPVGSDEAIAACKDAIRIHPAFIEAHTDLVQHYIRAGNEVAAKESLARAIPLDPYGAAPLLVDVMDHIRPEWFTEEYGKELGDLFSKHRSAVDDPMSDSEEYSEFSREEVTRILAAYGDQLAHLRALIDECTDVATASGEFQGSVSRKEKLHALQFVNISATRRGPEQWRYPPYTFFDATEAFTDEGEQAYLPPCFYAKVSGGLEIQGDQPAHWRVGLCQLWFEQPYCKPECATLLEFRVDAEVDDLPYRFAAKVLVVDEVAGQRQCVDELGESPMLDW